MHVQFGRRTEASAQARLLRPDDRNCSRLTGQPEVETDGRGGATMIYEISAPKGKTTVAVKITDMLGEEVIAAKEI